MAKMTGRLPNGSEVRMVFDDARCNGGLDLLLWLQSKGEVPPSDSTWPAVLAVQAAQKVKKPA